VLVLREVPELLSGARQVVDPKEGLLLSVVLVHCHKDVIDHSCPSLIPRWLQERLAQSKDRFKMEERCHAFLLFLVNSWV
jgi:hypothetical protein